jgi:hypothetical protein
MIWLPFASGFWGKQFAHEFNRRPTGSPTPCKTEASEPGQAFGQIVGCKSKKNAERFMNIKRKPMTMFCLAISIINLGCNAGQLVGHTFTPSSTTYTMVTPSITSTIQTKLPPTQTTSFSPTPDGINLNVLHNFPTSWDAFLTNPDSYVSCPYNPIDNPVEFRQWIDNVLTPALGNKSSRVNDINIPGVTGDEVNGLTLQTPTLAGEQLSGEPEFFWFEWQGEKYPVPVINVGMNGSVVTMAVAINDLPGNFGGAEFFQAIADGKKILSARIVSDQYAEYPDFMKQVVAAGFTGIFNGEGIAFGAGFVRFVYQLGH